MHSGIPKSTINALLSTKLNSLPRLPTLLHICEGLDTNLKEFFDNDIFLEVEDSLEDVSKILNNIINKKCVFHYNTNFCNNMSNSEK